jgi:hypothetical protein
MCAAAWPPALPIKICLAKLRPVNLTYRKFSIPLDPKCNDSSNVQRCAGIGAFTAYNCCEVGMRGQMEDRKACSGKMGGEAVSLKCVPGVSHGTVRLGGSLGRLGPPSMRALNSAFVECLPLHLK